MKKMPERNIQSTKLSSPFGVQGAKSLKAQHNILANAHEQLEILEHGQLKDFSLVPFQQRLEENNLYPLKPTQVEISR